MLNEIEILEIAGKADELTDKLEEVKKRLIENCDLYGEGAVPIEIVCKLIDEYNNIRKEQTAAQIAAIHAIFPR